MGEPGGPVGKSYPILQACSTKMTGGDLTVDSQDEFVAPPMVNEPRAGGGAQAGLNFWHFFTACAKVAGATDLISVKDMLAATAADALLAALGGSDLIGDDPTLAKGSIAGSRAARRCGGAARGAAAQRRPSRRGDHPRHRIIQHRLRVVQPAQPPPLRRRLRRKRRAPGRDGNRHQCGARPGHRHGSLPPAPTGPVRHVCRLWTGRVIGDLSCSDRKAAAAGSDQRHAQPGSAKWFAHSAAVKASGRTAVLSMNRFFCRAAAARRCRIFAKTCSIGFGFGFGFGRQGGRAAARARSPDVADRGACGLTL